MTQIYSDPRYWHTKGLQPGLRIIRINNTSLIDDYNIEDDDGHIDKLLTDEAIQDLLANADTDKFITMQFREEVSPEDYSMSLGLGIDPESVHNEEMKHNDNETKTGVSSSRYSAVPSTILAKSSTFRDSFLRIEDGQIGASSFEKGYEPSQCRLNNDKYWQPSGDDQTTLDTWLRIDLGMRRMVTKLQLQGLIKFDFYLFAICWQCVCFFVSETFLFFCFRES